MLAVFLSTVQIQDQVGVSGSRTPILDLILLKSIVRALAFFTRALAANDSGVGSFSLWVWVSFFLFFGFSEGLTFFLGAGLDFPGEVELYKR